MDHLGWTLQTNSIGLSKAGDWFAYPGSTTNFCVAVLAARRGQFQYLHLSA
jgi:hypothetical protein